MRTIVSRLAASCGWIIELDGNGAESRDREETDQVAADGLKIAEAHQVKAGSTVVEGEPAEAILGAAAAQGCDLIVVGAYGHARIREMFIGSTTNQLISESDIPVLLVP